MSPKFQFGNVVVVEGRYVGCIVKSWQAKDGYEYDVYVRSNNGVLCYPEDEIQHFIYDKEIDE